MKILNVTPYCISNYGAMLQAWALRKVLERLGHEVVYLRYPRVWPGKFGLKRILCSRSFEAMRSKLAVNRQMEIVKREVGGWAETRVYESPQELVKDPPQADCYLVGSDQVFHLDHLKDIPGARHSLLNFGSESTRRVAYAASFGRPSWTDSMINSHQWAIPLVKRFNRIGLRETTGLDILEKWSGVIGSWTPDPTLLLSADDYRMQFKIANLSTSRPRIVTYMLGYTADARRASFFEEVCKGVSSYLGETVEKVSQEPFMSLSEWMTNIANADYVITNSFHGICFSLIFNRPFIPLGFDGIEAWRNERAYDILRHIGLNDRYLTMENRRELGSILERRIDWNRINSRLKEFSSVGIDFLTNALMEDFFHR